MRPTLARLLTQLPLAAWLWHRGTHPQNFSSPRYFISSDQHVDFNQTHTHRGNQSIPNILHQSFQVLYNQHHCLYLSTNDFEDVGLLFTTGKENGSAFRISVGFSMSHIIVCDPGAGTHFIRSLIDRDGACGPLVLVLVASSSGVCIGLRVKIAIGMLPPISLQAQLIVYRQLKTLSPHHHHPPAYSCLPQLDILGRHDYLRPTALLTMS
ncbi:hypothetical protein BD779DRAFT_890352 [Infundibulicybe gibba]|nr:hypothetical protein BD779DRAFT_890352 [Infundibulicybe gibba]